ncbi:hypothetical protein PINS_up021973 [Pythium insidiosum]|nr:hypothetical protein PINS_up013646 [Pythium insidiosum]GLE09999.1 hypothetical protein PINS_up021973 [Pythium insidiosum]
MGNICHAGPVLRASEAAALPDVASPKNKKPLTFGRDPTLKKEDYIFSNIHAPTFLAKLPGSINGQQFLIENCSECDIFVLDHCTAVQIDDCVNCRIVIGPCESSLFLRNCKQCTIVCAVQQFRTRDCEDIDVYLYSSTGQSLFLSRVSSSPVLLAHLPVDTEPIIESSTRMRFACYPMTYFSLQHQFDQAKFSVWNNRWSEVCTRHSLRFIFNRSPGRPRTGVQLHAGSWLVEGALHELSRVAVDGVCLCFLPRLRRRTGTLEDAVVVCARAWAVHQRRPARCATVQRHDSAPRRRDCSRHRVRRGEGGSTTTSSVDAIFVD